MLKNFNRTSYMIFFKSRKNKNNWNAVIRPVRVILRNSGETLGFTSKTFSSLRQLAFCLSIPIVRIISHLISTPLKKCPRTPNWKIDSWTIEHFASGPLRENTSQVLMKVVLIKLFREDNTSVHVSEDLAAHVHVAYISWWHAVDRRNGPFYRPSSFVWPPSTP